MITRLPAKRRLIRLLLLQLVLINTVIAWHGVAHFYQHEAIQTSSHPQQTAATFDHQCDLCLSAHGFNSGPTLHFIHVLPPHLTYWVTAAKPLQAYPSPLLPPQARAPPAV